MAKAINAQAVPARVLDVLDLMAWDYMYVGLSGNSRNRRRARRTLLRAGFKLLPPQTMMGTWRVVR